MNMIETLYNLLEKIGYIHPIHPPVYPRPYWRSNGRFLPWTRCFVMAAAKSVDVCLSCDNHCLYIAHSYSVSRNHGLAALLFRSMDISHTDENCPGNYSTDTIINHLARFPEWQCTSFD